MNAAGPISLNLDALCAQLADCSSYQAFLGVSNSTAALARTYSAAIPPPSDGKNYTREELETTLRPFAVVSARNYGRRQTSMGGWVEHGSVVVWLEISVPTAYQPDPEVAAIDLTVDLEAGDRWINNHVGQIIQELSETGGGTTPGYVPINAIEVRIPPCREDDSESVAQGHSYSSVLEVEWGSTE